MTSPKSKKPVPAAAPTAVAKVRTATRDGMAEAFSAAGILLSVYDPVFSRMAWSMDDVEKHRRGLLVRADPMGESIVFIDFDDDDQIKKVVVLI